MPSMPVIRAIYSAVMWTLQPWLRIKLARRAIAEPLYGHRLEERFGRFGRVGPFASPSTEPTTTPLVWIHAVSLGEARVAAIVLPHLRAQLPGMRLLLTHSTATGWALGTQLLHTSLQNVITGFGSSKGIAVTEGANSVDVQTWLPWDTPSAVERFLAHFQPSLGLLIETEVWPNLVAGCARAGVPLALVNARLSDKSLKESQRLRWLSRPAYAGLAGVWAQTEADARRLTTLGARAVQVMGNLKFDAQPDAAKLALGRAIGRAWRRKHPARPVLMLASSREGEEAMLLDAIKSKSAAEHIEYTPSATKKIADDVQWLIVPRHPQRFDAVAALCEAAGFAVSRRSAWGEQFGEPLGEQTQDRPVIWLGDTLGDMALYYGLANAALLGGSFAPLGGQNLIEAAACACPVVMGSSTFNFAQAAALAEACGAAFRANNLNEALVAAVDLVNAAERLQAASESASQFASQHRGAALKLAVAIKTKFFAGAP